MSQVSKYPISQAVAQRIFDVLIKSLIKISNTAEAQNLASDLFSPSEKIMLAKRLGIAFLLMKGYQYREIRNILKVSLATIASVSTSLNYGKNGYKAILEKIAREEKLEEFFMGIAEKILSIPAKSSKGSRVWKDLQNDIRQRKIKAN